mgnify:FL=1|tara:strand:+ start:666 stop:1019 length:354 start_codon:yes stop_codon:yes gene_type:complete
MAKKTTPKKTEEKELVEEVLAPVVEKPVVEKKETKSSKLPAIPDPMTCALPTVEFIKLSFLSMTGVEASEAEIAHYTRSIDVLKFPKVDLHYDIKRGGLYYELHTLPKQSSANRNER